MEVPSEAIQSHLPRDNLRGIGLIDILIVATLVYMKTFGASRPAPSNNELEVWTEQVLHTLMSARSRQRG